jgi:hypothetical protein
MEIKKPDQVATDTPKAKKPWQTPRLTCETATTGAQKLPSTNDTNAHAFGPS